jgi:hypothetical protein
MFLRVRIVAALAAASVVAGTPVHAAPPTLASLRLESLDAKPVVRSDSSPTIVAFWRADCAPCLLELREAARYAAAAGSARFLFVGLQDAASLDDARRRVGAPREAIARANGDPAAILVAFNGAPPRLPLAVAFTPDVDICGRREGLLGTDRVRSWMLSCERRHAKG